MVGEDDILEANVTRAPYGIVFPQPRTNLRADVERIEDRRPMNPEMDVVYLLSPQPHIIDCLMADFERRRYRKSHLIWTSGQLYLLICSWSLLQIHGAPRANPPVATVLPLELRARLDQSALAREQVVRIRALNIDFFPRESHLITFRDPWSFPALFHPACNQLVPKHMDDLAQKVSHLSFTFPV